MSIPLPDNPFDMHGKVVLVTGGGSGLGADISRAFADHGAAVAVNYRKSSDAADKLAEEIRSSGGRAEAIQADVTDEGDVAKLIDQVAASFGRLVIVINNAGIYPLSPLTGMDPAEWTRVLDANLKSAFLVTQAAARQMSAQGDGGVIVNISSIEGLSPAPNHSHYSAAKAGLITFTKASARELGPDGIRINAVSPGLIWRQGLDEDWPDGVQRYTQAAPLQRLGQPEDVANACLFLASPAANWITGANLVVDGGVLTNQTY